MLCGKGERPEAWLPSPLKPLLYQPFIRFVQAFPRGASKGEGVPLFKIIAGAAEISNMCRRPLAVEPDRAGEREALCFREDKITKDYEQ